MTPIERSVAASWAEIEAWFEGHGPQLKLPTGATQQQLTELGALVPKELPAELLALYRQHNGDGFPGGLVGGWDLLSTSGVSAEWEGRARLARRSTSSTPADAHPAIKDIWWHELHVPIVSDGGGGFYCVDLDPGPKGTVGQVIYAGRDGNRALTARSVHEWWAAIAALLREGRVDFDSVDGLSDPGFSQASLEPLLGRASVDSPH